MSAAILPPDPLYCFKSNMGNIHSMCFVSNSHYATQLLAANEDGDVYFWDLECNRMLFKQNMGKSILTIDTFEDQIITQEKEGIVKLWELKKKSYGVVRTYGCAAGFCKIVRYLDTLIIPKDNYVIEVIGIKDFEVRRKFQATTSNFGQMMCVHLIQVSKRFCILAGFESGDVILFDYEEECQKSQFQISKEITSMTFDCYTRRGVCSNSSDSLDVFIVNPDFKMERKCVIALTNKGCNVVKLRGDGKIMVSGGVDGYVRIFSWNSLRTLAVLTAHKAGVTDVAFSEKIVNMWENQIMATSSSDGSIYIWSLYN